ncbi:hypothetical protein C6P92_15115 [Burkholderia multivorans]|nr:hypothetical protein C6P92_15115 [Burkholderia multivorans]PRG89745.1 hypothetical protein C6V04_21740 [Burkholderia multivorans]PRG97116.1 hypothetical protein C6T60_29695 [Burkholderia multivorans]QET31317.1 hypothetical protein FOB31_16650 [Burkholderia multivorans]QET41264.1 hypothetical protein FOB30_27215 [Burkholderia multivorans]
MRNGNKTLQFVTLRPLPRQLAHNGGARVRAGRSGWRGSSMRGVPMHERLPAAVASRPICQSFAVFL